ncbi:MAG: HdeD family acid-resistance protein [Actinomycetota bacterium]|nr:HdeD family acid-resistance protein [Actinomycetota bacterium]
MFGIATLAAGILTIAWPGNSLIAIAIVVGVQLIINGIFRLVIAFSELGQRHRAWLVFMGILSIVVGMLCLRDVFQTIFALTLVIGIFWTVHGVGHVFDAFARQDLPHRGWAILTGVLSVIAGIVIFAWPISSAFALALVLGVWLTVLGVMEIVASVRLKALQAGPVRV